MRQSKKGGDLVKQSRGRVRGLKRIAMSFLVFLLVFGQLVIPPVGGGTESKSCNH